MDFYFNDLQRFIMAMHVAPVLAYGFKYEVVAAHDLLQNGQQCMERNPIELNQIVDKVHKSVTELSFSRMTSMVAKTLFGLSAMVDLISSVNKIILNSFDSSFILN